MVDEIAHKEKRDEEGGQDAGQQEPPGDQPARPPRQWSKANQRSQPEEYCGEKTLLVAMNSIRNRSVYPRMCCG
jgi:hypothetical protein